MQHEEIQIKTAARYTKRKRNTAIGGSLLKTLAEPITNSDDSYRRMTKKGNEGVFPIDIYINTKTRFVRIIDHAEGMSFNDLKKKFEYYGADKSGASEGERVRGLFGQGIMDVLLYHKNGVIKTKKENKASRCSFFEKNDRASIVVEELSEENDGVFSEIGEHGTCVEFILEKGTSIHNFDNLVERLSSFYMLRFINNDDNRNIKLIYEDNKGRKRSKIKYTFPKGDLVDESSESFDFENKKIIIERTLHLSKGPLLTTGEERQNGLLIYDEENAVYELSLFGLDGLPHTDRFFGFVKLIGIRDLIIEKMNDKEHPEEILTDSRDGFHRGSNFHKELERRMKDWLFPFLSEERKRDGPLSQPLKKNHIEAFQELNKLYSELAGDDSSGTITTEEIKKPPGGLAFARDRIQVTYNKRYGIYLVIDTNVIKEGSVIEIESLKNKTIFSPDKIFVEKSEREDGLFLKTITIRGEKADTSDELRAIVGKRSCSLFVSFIRREMFYPNDAMQFHPDYMIAVPEKDSTLNLYIDLEKIKAGSKIMLSSSNKNIPLRKNVVSVKKNLNSGKIGKIEVVFYSSKLNESSVIEAVFGDHKTSARVEIKEREDKERFGKKGKFRGWDFSEIPLPYQHILDQDTKSPTSGFILINSKHPINKKYFGEVPDKSTTEESEAASMYLVELILNEALNTIVLEALKKGGIERRLGDDGDILFAITEKKCELGPKIYELFSTKKSFQEKMNKKGKEFSDFSDGENNNLTEREKEMIELRFGLNEKRAHTLDEIGRMFDITRERVRQIINFALAKKYGMEKIKSTDGDESSDYISQEENRIHEFTDKIIKYTAKEYNLSPKEIMKNTRKKEISFPRQVAMYLIRDFLELSFPSIGKIFNRDHTTVIHAFDKIQKIINKDMNKTTNKIEGIKRLKESIRGF